MKYTEIGFRALLNNFVVYGLNDTFKKGLEYHPNIDEANCVLTYPYIDHQAGLTLYVVTCGVKEDDGYTFFDADIKHRSIVRIGAVIDEDFAIIDDQDKTLAEKYSDLIDSLDVYNVNENIELARQDIRIDQMRNDLYPDDVLVKIVKDYLGPEECWVRIEDLSENGLIGTLLNEPYFDYGVHSGDKIEFMLYEVKTDSVETDRCEFIYDLSTGNDLSEKDTEGGKLLEQAINVFYKERNESSLLFILKILSESCLWIPCNAIISETDQERMNELAQNSTDDIVGKTFTTKDEVRLAPVVLQAEDGYLLPAFSKTEAMGEYSDKFSKVEKHMLQILNLAENNNQDISGIVINPFTDRFIVDKDLFDLIKKLKLEEQ